MVSFNKWATAFAYLGLGVALRVQISVKDDDSSLLKGEVDGRVVLMFAPNGTDPLEDTDVTSTPNKMFGKDVFGFGAGGKGVLFSGGDDDDDEDDDVYGFPLAGLEDIPAGTYTVQAFLTPYDKATRSDGSVVYLKFPCGDGAPNINGVGSLLTSTVDVELHEEEEGEEQTINLAFDSVIPVSPFSGKEIGGCSQGNYADGPLLKYVKIRSEVLSRFWGRDMYVGANVLLPSGYDASDKETRYPVLYNQNHWTGGRGPYGYGTNAAFTTAWENGMINENKPTPKLIIVAFRHEAPYYDDSYGVNTANLGPYGDAINDELIPYIDSLFNTIAQPYARIQDGGSTGGWISAASLIFRPDLFGACFSSYPDSLDFHRHQDIALYTNKNAYKRPNGESIGSIRVYEDDNEVVLATVEQENHWELVFGTSSRSSLQWDIWNAVFGVQGLNGYPLEPWDKVTGEIFPEAVEYWKEMDLSHYIVSNWDGPKQLGRVLKDRIYIYVGSHDNYYLDGGVDAFEKAVNGKGGPGWANVTVLEGQTHGGNYQRRETWDYLHFVETWVQDHAPDGKTPLAWGRVAKSSARGNEFADVLARGGRGAALARQSKPTLELEHKVKCGVKVRATAGRWDPGVVLEAQWVVDGKSSGDAFVVKQGEVITYRPRTVKGKDLEVVLRVTGSKRGYVDETRKSEPLLVERRR
ncbi:Alpha/Beta hydrolase protein [Poronia punctata]|nr:Alpha/Beta hydrolase protein [Poronia punctata]